MKYRNLYVCLALGFFKFYFTNGINIQETSHLSERFLVENFVPSFLKIQECILCKCYKECHASQYIFFDENSVCKPYWNSINCSDVDRCSCCNALPQFPACQNGGHCVSGGQGNFTCNCLTGFYGKKCEHKGSQPLSQIVDYCSSSPCLNGATCINGTSTYKCVCQNGWTGSICDKDIQPASQSINYCLSSPCLNGATCINGTNTYNCVCQKGWEGIDCNKDINECSRDPCINNTICVNTIGGFLCKLPGFQTDKNFTAGTLGVCNHECTIETVAKLRPVVSNVTDVCPGTNIRASNEALLLECCYLDRQISWYKGIQVMQNCKDGTIPSYTPIAAVSDGRVIPDTAGVLTSCKNDGTGFKMILQKCNASPQILTVDGSSGVDPNNYYVMFKI